jgi:Fe-S cluster biosynthesis and repair protein YggX
LGSSNEKVAIDKAMEVLDDFMETFNARDMESWSATLNYPHVRFSGGEVTVWDTKEDYAAVDIFKRLEATGWHHSAWLSRDMILISENKLHISTIFQRYDTNNQPTKKYQSLYIVTKENGHWGVKARSSLAP